MSGAIFDLQPDTMGDAKNDAPGWDVFYLFDQWHAWLNDGGMEPPRDADATFSGFCRRWYEKRGAPK